jgi:hypothetical protein
MEIFLITDINGYTMKLVKPTSMSCEISSHVVKRTIKEIVITPDHGNSRSTPEFHKSKQRLHEDGHYKCFVCGGTNDLEVHHQGCEWSLEEICDYDKLKDYCEKHDPYGYGYLLKNTPITTVDDIRNCMVLCQCHHTGIDHTTEGTGTGIHQMTGPIFNIQMIAKDGLVPVPQDGQSVEDIQKELNNAKV